MKTLFVGAGPLGSVYAHLLHESGAEVTVLERGARFDALQKNGLVLVNEMTDERQSSRVAVVQELRPEDAYDLAVVLIRKNKLQPVFELLASRPGVQCALFMGNNALGFDEYRAHLPDEKLLFGFPGAGGGLREHVVHYADRESPTGRRRPVTLGGISPGDDAKIAAVTRLFESARVPVARAKDIDSWLKYHAALVLPLVGALYKHDCDRHRLARDRDTLRTLVRAANEGARMLRALGFTTDVPVQLKLFRWLPEFVSVIGVRRLLESKFAEIAFAMHARAARDEMAELAREFEDLITRTTVVTPSIDALRSCFA